jgi:hypothetical protein
VKQLEVAKAAVHVVQSQKAEEEEGFNELEKCRNEQAGHGCTIINSHLVREII